MRDLFIIIAIAAVVLVAVGRWPAPPRATARLVVGFTRLIYPDIVPSVAGDGSGTNVSSSLSPRSAPEVGS